MKGDKLIRTTTTVAVAAALVLLAIKLLAYRMTGSAAVLGAAVDAAMDSVTTMFNFLAARYAMKPADADHRFGHGKAESLAALAQVTLTMGAAMYVGIEAVSRWQRHEAPEAAQAGIALMLAAIVINGGIVTLQRYTVRITHSPLIAADSLHYISDVVLHLGAVVALIVSDYGIVAVDSVIGVAVAVWLVRAALPIGREAFDGLMDRELSIDERDVICRVARGVAEVDDIHDVKTRRAGRKIHIQLHIEVDGSLSLHRAHEISNRVAARIRTEYPDSDILIHADPAGIDEPGQLRD